MATKILSTMLLLVALTATAHAQQVRCDEAGGTITGTDAVAVVVAIDGEVVRLTDDPDVDAAVHLDDFCAENPGLVAFVLPAPHPIGDEFPLGPPLPDPKPGQNGVNPGGSVDERDRPSFRRPSAPTKQGSGVDQAEEDEAPGDDGDDEAPVADEPAPSPAEAGPLDGPVDPHTPLDEHYAHAGGCSQSSGAPGAPWFLLPFALVALRRGGRR